MRNRTIRSASERFLSRWELHTIKNLIVEGLRDVAIITVDGSGRIKSWNAGAQQIIGYTDSEIIGEKLDVLFTNEDVQNGIPADQMSRALRDDNAIDDRWLVRKDGSMFWALGILSALYDEEGAFQGFAKLIHEQTARKRLEEEVTRRTQDLATRDRAKDEFLAMLGHELRNPLSAISSAVQAARILGSKDVERPLAIMDRQVRHMAQLVNDLLDVARVTQGKITLQLARVSLDSIVTSVARNSQETARNKGLQFETNIESGIFVQGDMVRLEQITGNLITNAIKYTPAGTVRVRLHKSEGRAVLTISDTGIGIDTELLPRLFELFSQSSRGLARSDGGLGVGLTIVKQLVELHGGTVEGQSEGEGRGSTFRVSFPLDESDNQGETQTQGDDKNLETRRTILVVDDSIDAAEMIALTLELWGYRVIVANDGEEAVATAEQETPQVVLLDIGLPRLDGYQVAMRLRQQYPSETMKLIALTGYAQESDVRKSLDSGFDTHLAKPINFGILRDVLHSFESEA